jgi:competence protein ComEC
MRAHNIFFYGTFFFLAGVLLSSIGLTNTILKLFILLLTTTLLITAIFRTKKTALFTLLTPLLLLGAVFHTNQHTNFIKNQNIEYNKKIEFTGTVTSNPQQKNLQEFKLKPEEPYRGQILVRATPFPKLAYGDIIALEGKIEPPPEGSYGRYLIKERVTGTITYPKIELKTPGPRSIKKTLFAIRTRVLQSFQQTLPYQESAFLSGITIGSREEFSKEFKEAMNRSGTTHLVALSGYNITILIGAAMATLTLILRRRTAFLATIVIIIAFVVLTGAEASVVRAAIMGTLAAMAPFVSRIYAPRNAIAASALIMTLENPNVLAHDVGFQLSFLALIGIIYFKPALEKILRRNKNPGLLAWRENFWTTLSAQLLVAPLLIITFGSFTLTSLIANVVILEAIPVTMTLGFLLAGIHLISYHAALLIAWLTIPLLKFELLIIETFAKLALPIQPTLTLPIIAAYYIILIIVAMHGKILFRHTNKRR